jgi:hypothetical protein
MIPLITSALRKGNSDFGTQEVEGASGWGFESNFEAGMTYLGGKKKKESS